MRMMDDMHTALANYIRTSDPNGGTLQLPWPTGGQYVFSTPNSRVEGDYRGQYCDFWDTIGYDRGSSAKMRARVARRR